MDKLKKILLLACIALCSTSMFAQVSNNNEDGVYKVDRHSQGAYRQGEVIVKFKADGAVKKMARGKFKTSAVNSVDQILAELGATEVEPLMPLTGALKANAPRKVKAFNGKDIDLKDLSKLYTIHLDAAKTASIHDAIEKLRALDEVEFAEPNYLTFIQSSDDGLAFDDPLFSQQTNLSAVNLPQLWAMPKITSKRPVIAILDTGVDITHPDLADNIWTNLGEENGQDEADDDNNGFTDDVHGWDFVLQSPTMRDRNGHGTHCAGIAAAVGGNGIGIVGANPDALIMPITVMQSDGTGDIATIIKGIDYAVANGADVLSMSIGTYQYSLAMEQALGRAYANAVLVAAAGNDAGDINGCHAIATGPMFPAAFTFVLGVQAKDAGFSNWDCDGPTFSSHGEEKLYNYEISAPGTQIMSTFPQGKYKSMSGTSMACPLVAGAVSRLYQCKDIASKEILFGDLIHTSQGFYENRSVSMLDIFAAYNIKDEDRIPELEFIGFEMSDTDGDDDGRYDAGEVVDIYPTIRNTWGHAENIRYSIELINELGDPDFVEFLVPEATLGRNLDGYAKAKGVNPLRIRLSDKCVDGQHLQFRIKGTCDNSALDFSQDFTIDVENGIELGGMITKDLTLYPEKQYIVTRNLVVPSGVTLTILPGTVLKFKDQTGFSASGTVICEGTKDNMIVFTSADLNTSSIQKIQFNDVVKYTKFSNLNFIGSTNGGTPFILGNYENCVFEYLTIPYFNNLLGVNSKAEFSNFYYNTTGLGCWDNGASLRSCNVVSNSLPGNDLNEWPQHEATCINNCNVINNYEIESHNIYNISFGNIPWLYGEPVVYRPEEPSYFGTSVERFARIGIYDLENPITPNGDCLFDLSNMLTRPSSKAHGIVWKIVVNGYDAQDEFNALPSLGVGKHKFEVYFNRPMDRNKVPAISMGVRPPYTQTVIAEDGEWNEAGDVYTAYLTITGKSNYDGLNRIRVYGAQDDESFEIPEESYRFNVMVQKTGSMSTGLMAEAGLGKVKLTWDTDEDSFADLMGYNVYRYTEEPDKAAMVNAGLIEPSETEFVDYDVVPGTTYYYLVKEMGTDLLQHDISNVVAATPLTAQKGDANGSMSVDVADVVTEVAYLTDQDPQPFIFEAADVNEDNTINILDVVGTVNLIMTPAGAGTASADNTATFTVEDGILYVDATTPLGGVQVLVNADADTEFETLEGLNGMERTGNWMSANEYQLLAFSMVGNTISIGKQPLLRIGDATVKALVASDAKGKNVLAINGAATSIEQLPFGIDDVKNAEMRYYDLSGRMISSQAAKKKGMYIQSIFVGGKCVKSYKIMK